MPKKLSEYNTGDTVEMICYKKSCENVSIPVVLGREARIEPGTHFTDAGRLHWSSDVPRRVFNAVQEYNCPNCGTPLGSVNIVGEENLLIFGYEREPGT